MFRVSCIATAVMISLGCAMTAFADDDLTINDEQDLDAPAAMKEPTPTDEEMFALGEKQIIATKPVTLPTTKITVDLKQTGARKALITLLYNSGLKYNLGADVTNDVKVDVTAAKTNWSEVFSQVVAQAKLQYETASDGTLQIKSTVK